MDNGFFKKYKKERKKNHFKIQSKVQEILKELSGKCLRLSDQQVMVLATKPDRLS